MKPILDEAKYLELSNHINYKAIGSVLSEIWIFEVDHRILSQVLARHEFEGHNSPYITLNGMQQILLKS